MATPRVGPAGTAPFSAVRRPDTEWTGGKPLSEARNAHRTNTREELEAAANSNANWFEGDVRLEIDGSGLEMRHDRQHESGDNLTLREWLEAGKKSGRGLKLDVKEPEHMKAILDEVARAQLPPGRLMLNLGFGAMEKWGPEIRARFPNATLAINPPTEQRVDARAAARMVEQAKALGGPVTFVVRHDRLTDAAIAEFKKHPGATISVWGSTGDVAQTTAALKARGVNGMIDLAPPHGVGVGDVLEAGKNWVRTGLDKLF